MRMKIIFISIIIFTSFSCKCRNNSAFAKIESAVERKDSVKLERLLQKNRIQNEEDFFRLMDLALKNQDSFSIPMVMIENGFPVNSYRIRDKGENLTLLALAIKKHDFDAAKKMVDFGADILTPINDERVFDCPLYCAMDSYSNELVSYMIDSFLQKNPMSKEDFYEVVLQGFKNHLAPHEMLANVLSKNSFPYTEKNCKLLCEIIIKNIYNKSDISEYLKLIFEDKRFVLDPDSVSQILQAVYLVQDKQALEYFLSFGDLYLKLLASTNTPFLFIRDSKDEFGKELLDRLKKEKLTFGQQEPYLPYAIEFGYYESIPWLLQNGVSPYFVVNYNGNPVNAFDCIDRKEKLLRMAMPYDDQELVESQKREYHKLEKIRKIFEMYK